MAQDPTSSPNRGMSILLRVQVLGPLRVTGADGVVPVPRAAHHLLAALAGAGPSGISREALARELWGAELPNSWMSALRNRTTAARKALGASSVLTTKGRYHFGPNVRVDSWDLLNHRLDSSDSSNELQFLDGTPLVDIPESELTVAHGQRVHEARSTLIETTLASDQPLSRLALQTLRIYQREHPLDPSVAVSTVRAHLAANQRDRAASVIDGLKSATTAAGQTPAWVVELERSFNTNAITPPVESPLQAHAVEARTRLFAAAAKDQNWSLALEIAMEGLPEAERIEGDPERLALLETIPLDGLEPSLRFSLALALARHLMYAGRETEAHQWSRTTRELASSPSEELLCYITSALVGDAEDQRRPIPLPDAFESTPSEAVNMRSLQVAVMSHLERDSFEGAAALQRRFTDLVETSAEPYRRWHLLLLQSMTKFVNGSLTAAAEAAKAAFDYACLFGILDAEIALIGQLSNARLIDPSLPGIDDYPGQYPTSSSSSLSRALQAVGHARRGDDNAVDAFLHSYDFRNRMFFTFAVVNAVAPYVRSPELRDEIAHQLRERTGTSSIWGTGVLHLGPVDRTLARVLDDRHQTTTLLADAIAVADRQHSCIWQVICRLDQAAATGEPMWRKQAEALAITPDLQRLVTTYEPWPALVTS